MRLNFLQRPRDREGESALVSPEVTEGARGLRREGGASAVEMALLFPVLAIFLFGIIEFGVAFLQVQSIRTGVREGGRVAAVGAQVSTTQQRTVAASVGSIPSGQASNVQVQSNQGGRCTPQNIGSDVTVIYDTANLPGGGVLVRIPLISDIVMKPVIKASFRCEV
jgi:Flp pilus assembly protein TadG